MGTAIKRGAVVWLSALAILLAWSGGAAVANRGEEERVADATAQVERMERFYRIVAGQISGGPTPGDKLARDLHNLRYEFVSGFKGDSNKYGGIADDLGFDPFVDGDNCSECGYLDADIRDNVASIKQGRIGAVLAANRAKSVEPADETSGPPGFLWLLWIVSFPAYCAVTGVRRRKETAERYQEVATEHDLVGRLRAAQRELPAGSPEFNRLGDLATRLAMQMDKRISYSQAKKQQMRLEYLTNEATAALEAMEAGNRSLD